MTTDTTANPHASPRVRRAWSLKKKILVSSLTVLLVLVIVVRIYFSTWLLNYVNNVLAHIDGYKGSVESINIDLYRGAYRINKLVLDKDDGKIPTPFIAIDHVDFSLQWRALFHRRIVADAVLEKPVIHFAVTESSKQTGEGVDWTKPIKDLMPIDIDYVRFADGTIGYQDFSSTPHVDIYIHHMDGVVRNLRNADRTDEALPSTINVNGDSIGNGKLRIDGRLNILKAVPDMNLKVSLEDMNLPAINSYTEAYAAFDFKSGSMSIYNQIKIKDGNVTGYVKPVVTHLSVDVLKNANPLRIAWNTFIAGVLQIFTNITKDQFATRVDLDGHIGNINTDAWSAISGILRNAFIQAMDKGFEQTGSKQPAEPGP